MIEVMYCKEKDFVKNYCQRVESVIKQKMRAVKKQADNHLQEIADIIADIPKEMEWDILSKNIDELVNYDWINEYLKLADFCARAKEFEEEFRNNGGNCKDTRIEFVRRYDGTWLKKIHHGEIESICRTVGTYKSFKKEAAKCLHECNEIIGCRFDYDYLETDFKRTLFRDMDVKVCPYCNMEYVDILDDGRYLGDLDHVYPKSVYALFSLSIWNLIPSCKKCNQNLKKNKTKRILNPTHRGFGRDAVFRVKTVDIRALRGESYEFDVEWKIMNDDKELNSKLRHNIKIFKLDDRYRREKKKIQDVLKKKFYMDNTYLKDYMKMLNISSEDELNYSLYGSSLNPQRFKDELLSKMIYDLVMY